MKNLKLEKMYSISDLKGMLFIDIETSTMAKDLDGFAEMVGENGKDHWDKKSKSLRIISNNLFNKGMLDDLLRYTPVLLNLGSFHVSSNRKSTSSSFITFRYIFLI